MAGMAGIQGKDNGELARMLERIKHRGPHETWVNQEKRVTLGCCELNLGENSKTGWWAGGTPSGQTSSVI